MAPTKRKRSQPKTQVESEVSTIGPIYPVFHEQRTKKGGKIHKKIVLKEKLIWVKWKSEDQKEEWTAEPLKNFSGESKQKALAVIRKKECWPWIDRARIDAMRVQGYREYKEKRTYNLINNMATQKTKEVEVESTDEDDDDEEEEDDV